jgi:hypothetical protein
VARTAALAPLSCACAPQTLAFCLSLRLAASHTRRALTRPAAPPAVAALCRALLSALRQATAKGTFSAAGVLAAFPRVCVLFEEIVSEGVVEATDTDTLQAGVRLKTAASAAS